MNSQNLIKNSQNPEDQVILINKPADVSSFHVVVKVRGHLRTTYGHKVKVGHTGTLDPFATGLLILLSGNCTKRASEFLKLDKTYEAVLRLGYTSTTGDTEGEVGIYEGLLDQFRTGIKYATPKLETVQAVTRAFTGTTFQKVPRFSAVKIHGQRAYKLARKGAKFDTPVREVTIYNIEIISYNYPELIIRTRVSSGTYIRTLAEDIGKCLGTGAYLASLRRTQIGDYRIEDAQSFSDFLPPFPYSTTQQ